MAITDWPEGERPREKLLQRGAGALSDAELLAIFLRTGVTGKTAVDLARDLLNDFGGLRPLLGASHSAFTAAHGLGDAKYVQLQATLEMARRHFDQTLQTRDVLSAPHETHAYLMRQLRDYPYEVFAVLLLDSRNHVLGFEKLFRGSINASTVHVREVVQAALDCRATALICAHNHPSGSPQPSVADKTITQRLRDALGLFDIILHDHVIIGDGEFFSFSQAGLLQQ